MERFGEILTELRQDRAWTQRQLAERLHVSIGTISNYENNNHLPAERSTVNNIVCLFCNTETE